MPRHQRIRSRSGYYHVMIRGNEKKAIFSDDEDRLRFIEILHDKKHESAFLLHAFCLMDNHVHLMLQEKVNDIATIMKRINISYVHYFNKKYNREGHLFQDRFKSEIIEDESYALALIRYIHQNPVKAGLVKLAEEYKWSSYPGYLNENHHFAKALDMDMILGLFSEDRSIAKKQFKNYINQTAVDSFIDIKEKVAEMDEEAATALWVIMLGRINASDDVHTLVKEFREESKMSIRKIAKITGFNKDKINKMVQ